MILPNVLFLSYCKNKKLIYKNDVFVIVKKSILWYNQVMKQRSK